MNLRKHLAVFAAALSLSSCQDVVQVKLDNGSTIYVIDAFVNDLSKDQVIHLSTSDSYFSNKKAPPITGASVNVIDLSSGRRYNFADKGAGDYVLGAADSLGHEGHQYRLEVAIGSQTYTALSVQNRKASIDSISPTYVDGNGGFGPPTDPFYFCTLYAKDRTDQNPDYYWVKTFRNDTLQFGPADINVSIDGTNGPVYIPGVDSTAFTPPVTFIGFKQYHSGNSCRVEIHTLSREAYNFFIQASAQVNNGGLFATTPENVKTNIITPKGAVKAVGWFNVAGVTSHSIVLP